MKAAVFELSDATCVERDVSELLCMPQVLIDLIEACLGGAGVQSLAEIVLQDAALTTKILAASTKTGSEPLDASEPVTAALTELGVPMVTGIALQSAKQIVASGLRGPALTFQYGLWFSSRVAATAARCLAPSINYPRIEEAQLSGLLLNLGIQIFFGRDRTGYPVLDVKPWSSSVQCQFEQGRYGMDHLQLADELIGQWELDSFLADAVHFLHADILQVEQSSSLLKIARLANAFSQSPEALSDETRQLADHLFGLTQSEVEYLFDWAHGLYPAYSGSMKDETRLEEDFSASIQRLTDLIFMLADQEAARARLSGAEDRLDLIRIARSLYLENSSAADAVFFLLDQQNNQIVGIPVEGQPRVAAEMKISCDADICLATRALLHGEPYHSLSDNQSLSVTDQLLMRLCKCPAIFCVPFRVDGRPLGVAVLGVREKAALETLQSLQIRMFGQVISSALSEVADGGDVSLPGEGNAALQRVSQEINTPLTVIGNYAEVLGYLHKEGENAELVESIKKEAQRIDEIVSYYLDQQDVPDLPEQSTDLNQLLRELVAQSDDAELKRQSIQLQLCLDSDLERIATNPVLVRKVLNGLLQNALEALADGGTVSLSTRTRIVADFGRCLEFVVQDDGPGIPLPIQEQLFRPVVSTKGGTHAGMGLNIVKTMVDDLGGQISCHSSSGSGTSFHVLLPFKGHRLLDV